MRCNFITSRNSKKEKIAVPVNCQSRFKSQVKFLMFEEIIVKRAYR